MQEIIIIAIVACGLLGWMALEIKARRDNRKWLDLKAKAKEQLKQYEVTGAHYEHAKWLVDKHCEVCDRIAAGGLMDSKQNILFAEYSTTLLKELKRIGFFDKRVEK